MRLPVFAPSRSGRIVRGPFERQGEHSLRCTEEPENFLHPRLLPELAEECREASGRTQLLVTTHSPFFLDALRPEEVRVLWRDEAGYTRSVRAADLPGVPQFVRHGALLGHLWMEGLLGAGDPLVNAGAPTGPAGREERR